MRAARAKSTESKSRGRKPQREHEGDDRERRRESLLALDGGCALDGPDLGETPQCIGGPWRLIGGERLPARYLGQPLHE